MQINSTKTSVVGSIWAIFSKVGQSLCQVIMIIVLARLLDAKEFGVVSLAMIFIVLAKTVIIQGFSPVLILRDNLSSRYLSHFIGATIFASIILSLATSMCANYIGSWFDSDELVIVIEILSLTIFISSISAIPRAILQREKKFKTISKIELSSYVFGYGVIGVSFAFNGFGVYSLVFAYIAQSCIEVVLYLTTYKGTKRARFDYHEWVSIFKLVMAYTVSQIGFKLNQQVDQIILSKLGGIEALGLYGRAKQLLMFPINILAGVADKVAFPMLVKSETEKEFCQIFDLFFYAFFCISLIAASFLLLNAEFIVKIILGEGWGSVTPMFELLAVSFPIRVLSYIIYTAIKSKGDLKFQIIVSYISTIVIVISSMIFYPIFGTEGVIGSYISVSMIVLVFYAVILKGRTSVFNGGFAAKLCAKTSPAIAGSLIMLISSYLIDSVVTFCILSLGVMLIFFLHFFFDLKTQIKRDR